MQSETEQNMGKSIRRALIGIAQNAVNIPIYTNKNYILISIFVTKRLWHFVVDDGGFLASQLT